MIVFEVVASGGKFYSTLEKGYYLGSHDLARRSGQFVAAVLAADAPDNLGLAELVEDLLEILPRDLFSPGYFLDLHQALTVIFSQGKECFQAIFTFSADGKHFSPVTLQTSP